MICNQPETKIDSNRMLTFITGMKGFVGSAMCSYVDTHGPECGIEIYPQAGEVDVMNKAVLAETFKTNMPDAILHLAAISYVPASFENPEQTYMVNFMGTLRLLQALKESGFTGRFLYIGTSDAYGKVDETELPVDEERALAPRNPYAVSKVAAEYLCYQWSQTENMDIMMARPFNHIGPGQAPHFVVSDFARQIAMIKLGMAEPVLNTGNIDVTRDFTDVQDVVRAYILLLLHGRNGEKYNICSGKEISIRIIIEKLIELSNVDISLKQDQKRVRPVEQKRAYGSCEKLQRETGWTQNIGLDESLRNIFKYWEKKLANG